MAQVAGESRGHTDEAVWRSRELRVRGRVLAAAVATAFLVPVFVALLAIAGPSSGTVLLYFAMVVIVTVFWRATRSRVLVDAERVLVVNAFGFRRFEWQQVMGLSQVSGVTFEVRTPPYVDLVHAGALGGFSVLSYYSEGSDAQQAYWQLRQLWVGALALDKVGRPSSLATEDLARWSSWRREVVVIGGLAATGLVVALGHLFIT
jgi:hypothetical protein